MSIDTLQQKVNNYRSDFFQLLRENGQFLSFDELKKEHHYVVNMAAVNNEVFNTQDLMKVYVAVSSKEIRVEEIVN